MLFYYKMGRDGKRQNEVYYMKALFILNFMYEKRRTEDAVRRFRWLKKPGGGAEPDKGLPLPARRSVIR